MKTETSQHTAIPWHVVSGAVWKDDIPIAHMDRGAGNGTLPVERDDNAAFIVLACNSHEALIEACKALRDAYDAGADGIAIEWDDVDHAYHLALNALGTD